jgi:hypothetical protein
MRHQFRERFDSETGPGGELNASNLIFPRGRLTSRRHIQSDLVRRFPVVNDPEATDSTTPSVIGERLKFLVSQSQHYRERLERVAKA